MTRALALLVVVALTPRPARAQDAETLSRARARFEAGRALYVLGDYESALREFMIGYQLVQRPEFLINLGQTYNRLKQPDKAREMYERFLATASKDDPNRPGVERLVSELPPPSAQSRPVEPSPSAPSSPSSSSPASPSPSPALAAPAPSAASPSLTSTAPPPKKHFDKRHLGWIVPLAAVVVAGAAVGIYFGTRTSDGCIGGLPCVDSTHSH